MTQAGRFRVLMGRHWHQGCGEAREFSRATFLHMLETEADFDWLVLADHGPAPEGHEGCTLEGCRAHRLKSTVRTVSGSGVDLDAHEVDESEIPGIHEAIVAQWMNGRLPGDVLYLTRRGARVMWIDGTTHDLDLARRANIARARAVDDVFRGLKGVEGLHVDLAVAGQAERLWWLPGAMKPGATERLPINVIRNRDRNVEATARTIEEWASAGGSNGSDNGHESPSAPPKREGGWRPGTIIDTPQRAMETLRVALASLGPWAAIPRHNEDGLIDWFRVGAGCASVIADHPALEEKVERVFLAWAGQPGAESAYDEAGCRKLLRSMRRPRGTQRIGLGTLVKIGREASEIGLDPCSDDRFHKAPDPETPEDPSEPEESESHREVFVPGNHLPDVGRVSEARFATRTLNCVPKGNVFAYGPDVVTACDDTMRTATLDSMRLVASRHVSLMGDKFYKDGTSKRGARPWTKDLSGIVIARAYEAHPNVLRVKAVVNQPMPYVDQDVLRFMTPGWNPGGYFHIEDPRLAGAEPMRDRERILEVLTRAIRDYPFAAFPQSEGDEFPRNTPLASKANALALILSPFIISMNLEENPMFVTMAPTRATGKTTLLEACMLGSTGKDPTKKIGIPTNPEKFTEYITSIVKQPGNRCALFDNIRSDEPLAIGELEALITTREVADRAKYAADGRNYPNNVIWAMSLQTGMRLNADMASRSIGIYLDAGMETPDTRDFTFVPAEVARESYREVTEAMMGAVALWFEAGSPGCADGVPQTRFARWQALVGGILRVISPEIGAAFLGNKDAFIGHAHSKDDPFTSFVEEWIGWNGGGESTTSDLFTHVFRKMEIDVYLPGKGDAASLGRWLAKHEGQIAKGRKYRRWKGDRGMMHEARMI